MTDSRHYCGQCSSIYEHCYTPTAPSSPLFSSAVTHNTTQDREIVGHRIAGSRDAGRISLTILWYFSYLQKKKKPRKWVLYIKISRKKKNHRYPIARCVCTAKTCKRAERARPESTLRRDDVARAVRPSVIGDGGVRDRHRQLTNRLICNREG